MTRLNSVRLGLARTKLSVTVLRRWEWVRREQNSNLACCWIARKTRHSFPEYHRYLHDYVVREGEKKATSYREK